MGGRSRTAASVRDELSDDSDASIDNHQTNDDDDDISISDSSVHSYKAKPVNFSTKYVEQQDEPNLMISIKKSGKKSSTAQKKQADNVVKKGPGRPRKTPKKEPEPRRGILKISKNEDHYIEFQYDQPMIFKKVFQFFKSLASTQIQILFRQTDIIIYGIDHHSVSKIYIKIDANKLNHYYCKAPLDIGIAAKDIELVFNKVDKEYQSISIISQVMSINRNITIIFENDMQINEVHTLDLIGHYNTMEDESMFIDENYLIKCEMPSKVFKKTVADIKTMSSHLSITQESNDSPLMFDYATENGKIHSRHIIKKNEKIKIDSGMGIDDTFRVEVKIDYINPISKSHIAETLTLMLDENKPFMTKSFIDNETIEIKTLTEIVDMRECE